MNPPQIPSTPSTFFLHKYESRAGGAEFRQGLTKKEIDAANHPERGQIFLRDDVLRGFGVRLTPGSKTFILEKLIPGRVRRMTLGRYGTMTLDDARSIVRKRMAEIDEGRDPVAERRKLNQAPTFHDLEQMYLTRHVALKKSRANYEGLLTHHLADWRPRRLASITREDIARLHHKDWNRTEQCHSSGRLGAATHAAHREFHAHTSQDYVQPCARLGLHPGPNPCLRIRFMQWYAPTSQGEPTTLDKAFGIGPRQGDSPSMQHDRDLGEMGPYV
jgi:hypothetical protein